MRWMLAILFGLSFTACQPGNDDVEGDDDNDAEGDDDPGYTVSDGCFDLFGPPWQGIHECINNTYWTDDSQAGWEDLTLSSCEDQCSTEELVDQDVFEGCADGITWEPDGSNTSCDMVWDPACEDLIDQYPCLASFREGL